MPDPQDHPDRPAAGAEVVTADGRSLPLVSARLSGIACGGIARLVLEQRFENHHAETLHVTYRMPLPADGAISGYAFVIADRTIAGRVERKRDARERFERAIAAGHTAALLEQERADIFTQAIGNLPANEALIARITIDQRLAWLPEGEWELRFPTVIGPRYVAAGDTTAEVRGAGIRTVPDGVPARIHIAIDIRDAIVGERRPTSPSHALVAGAGGVVELGDVAGARLDRDLVVRWPVAGASTGISLATVRPAGSDDCYGLVTIVPPVPAALDRSHNRDLIVLIDTSGSMAGPPLDKAKQVIALLIESLGDHDLLELIAFSSEPRRYMPAPVVASPSEKQLAIRWLRGLSAGGGTEMRTAIIEALRVLRIGAQRQVVVATDGYIGGETSIVAQLHGGLPASCRLHFVGIGSSVNRSLATAMARAGRGAEVLCDLGDDAERAAKRLIDRTRSPVLTDITIDGSAVIARAPEAIADVYAASPVVAAVKLGAGELVVRGRLRDNVWERRLRIGMPRPGDGSHAIAALFGRERVADLEARGFGGENHDAEIERTGLAFQIATRLTPFIAVDEHRTVQPALRHEAVPQHLPYGTTAAAFGLRTASAGHRRFESRHLGMVTEAFYDEDDDLDDLASSSAILDIDELDARVASPSLAFEQDDLDLDHPDDEIDAPRARGDSLVYRRSDHVFDSDFAAEADTARVELGRLRDTQPNIEPPARSLADPGWGRDDAGEADAGFPEDAPPEARRGRTIPDQSSPREPSMRARHIRRSVSALISIREMTEDREPSGTVTERPVVAAAPRPPIADPQALEPSVAPEEPVLRNAEVASRHGALRAAIARWSVRARVFAILAILAILVALLWWLVR